MNTKVRLQLSAMMFGEFFVWGAWFVTLWPYLKALKFDGVQIGAAYSTTAWAAIISPFFVGMVADRFFSAEKVLGLLHLFGAVVLYYASTVTEPAICFWVLLLYALCYMPTLALVNAISFNQMKDPGQEFPHIRVLGTIGWIVAGVLVGFMPKSISGLETIEDTNIPMRIAAGTSVLMGLYCFFLPHTPPKTAGQKVTISDVLGLKSLKLMKERSFAVFVICSFLICIPLSFYYQSANGFLGEIGIENAAAKMTLGQMSEIFFMLVMPFFFVRLGVKKMLLVGMLFWIGRYFLFAWGGGEGVTLMMIYLGILFHGICYDFFFVTGQVYVDKKAPADIRASAQGFIAFVTLGVGMLIGNYVNGWVTKYYTITNEAGQVSHNWHQIWLIPAIMAVIVAVFFVFLFKENNGSAKEANNG